MYCISYKKFGKIKSDDSTYPPIVISFMAESIKRHIFFGTIFLNKFETLKAEQESLKSSSTQAEELELPLLIYFYVFNFRLLMMRIC